MACEPDGEGPCAGGFIRIDCSSLCHGGDCHACKQILTFPDESRLIRTNGYFRLR